MVQALEPVKPNASRTRRSQVQSVRAGCSAAAVPASAAAGAASWPARSRRADRAIRSKRRWPRRSRTATPPASVRAPEDDGITVEPYIPAGRCTSLSKKRRDAPRRRCPASMCPPAPSVREASAACRARRSCRLLRGGHSEPQKAEAEPRNARALFKRLASNVGLNLGHEAEPSRSRDRVHAAIDDAAARSAIEAGAPRFRTLRVRQPRAPAASSIPMAARRLAAGRRRSRSRSRHSSSTVKHNVEDQSEIDPARLPRRVFFVYRRRRHRPWRLEYFDAETFGAAAHPRRVRSSSPVSASIAACPSP